MSLKTMSLIRHHFTPRKVGIPFSSVRAWLFFLLFFFVSLDVTESLALQGADDAAHSSSKLFLSGRQWTRWSHIIGMCSILLQAYVSLSFLGILWFLPTSQMLEVGLSLGVHYNGLALNLGCVHAQSCIVFLGKFMDPLTRIMPSWRWMLT